MLPLFFSTHRVRLHVVTIFVLGAEPSRERTNCVCREPAGVHARGATRLTTLATSLALTIWVASSQLAQPVTDAMVRAASEVLGPSVTVRVAEFSGDQPESLPVRAGERSVRVTWSSERHESAHLTLCRTSNDCFERSVAFEAQDPELERGRTLGFLAAAVFLEESPRPTRAEPRAAPPPSAPVRLEPRFFASAAVALAAPGDATTFGAELGASYAPLHPVRLGVAFELRFGELTAAQANSRVGAALASLEYVVFEPSRAVWLGVGLRAGAYELSLSHLSDDDPAPVRKARWLFGGDAALVLGYRVGGSASLFAAPGVEVLSGWTEVVVHEAVQVTWPVAIPLFRLGFQAALFP